MSPLNDLESRLVFAGPSMTNVSFEADFRPDYHWIASEARRMLQCMSPRNTMERLFHKAKKLYDERVKQRKKAHAEYGLEHAVAYGKTVEKPIVDERARSYVRVTQRILSAKRMSKKIASLTAMYLIEYIKVSKYKKSSRDY